MSPNDLIAFENISIETDNVINPFDAIFAFFSNPDSTFINTKSSPITPAMPRSPFARPDQLILEILFKDTDNISIAVLNPIIKEIDFVTPDISSENFVNILIDPRSSPNSTEIPASALANLSPSIVAIINNDAARIAIAFAICINVPAFNLS